jgi:hypothetical protein
MSSYMDDAKDELQFATPIGITLQRFILYTP